MLITLAVIGAFAIFAWFIKAIGLKRIHLEFDHKPVRLRTKMKSDENSTRQLKD